MRTEKKKKLTAKEKSSLGASYGVQLKLQDPRNTDTDTFGWYQQGGNHLASRNTRNEWNSGTIPKDFAHKTNDTCKAMLMNISNLECDHDIKFRG